MARKGITDTDMGFKKILKEMEKLKSMCVKVGVTEEAGAKAVEGGPTVAQYAAWNELGVLRKKKKKGKGKWFIPPRPFVRGFADGKRELITKTMEKLGGLVTDGKLDAETAIRALAEFGQNGVQTYIQAGTFTPNSDITKNGLRDEKGKLVLKKDGTPVIPGKKSSHPLIDTGTLVNNGIRFQIIKQPVGQASEE